MVGASRVHGDRFRPQRADRIDEKCNRVDVIEVRVGDEDMVDQRQLGEREVADPGPRVDQNILVDQERSGPVLLSADTARAAQHAQLHYCSSAQV